MRFLNSILRRADNLHVGFENLRRAGLDEHKRNVVFEAMFLRFRNHFTELLESAKDDHARRTLFPLLRLRLQQTGGEGKEVSDIEAVIRLERGLPRLVAGSIRHVSSRIPGRIGGIEGIAQVVGNVSNYAIRPGNLVLLRVLEVIPDKLTFDHWLPPPWYSLLPEPILARHKPMLRYASASRRWSPPPSSSPR